MHKKQIFKIDVLKKLLEDKNNCVSLVPCTRVLALPPFYLNDLKLGVVCLLNSFLKKYDRALDGILIGYQNIVIKMDENSGIIPMGAAEIEINVSVEFYIFQPKIGSHLEAIVNKTSQNHIGCLVHKYFNATILKPEDVDHEDWICKNYKEGDKIIFKVKDLDFTGVLPYIEGIMDEEIVSKQRIFQCDSNKRSPQKDCKEISKEEIIEKDIFNSLFNSKVKKQNRNEEEDDIDEDLNEILNQLVAKNLEVVESGSEGSKKKKKKEKEKKIKKNKEVAVNPIKSTADEDKDLTDFTKSTTKDGTSTNEHENKKKKKKKKKEKDKDRDKFEVLTQILPEDIFGVHYVEDNGETLPKVEEEDNKVIQKSKKKEKKAKNVSVAAESPKKSECPTADLKEDSFFHSTQLESKASDRFIMPFCSPILQTDTIKKKEKKQKMPQSRHLEDLKEKVDKSEKKSSKKRKREDVEDDSISKKPSLGIKSPVKVVETNGHISSDEKSETQSLWKTVYQKQMNRLKESWKEDDNSEQKKEKNKKKDESKSNSRKEKKGNKKMENKLSERVNEEVSEMTKQEDEKDTKIFHKLSEEKEKEVSRKVGDSPKKSDKKIKNKLLEPKEEKVEKSPEQEDKIISDMINQLLQQKKNEMIEDKLSVQENKNINESFKQEKEEINGKEKAEAIKLKNEADLEINDRLSDQKEKKVSEKIPNKSPKKLEKKVSKKVSKKTENKTLEQNGENDNSQNEKKGSELSLVEKLLQEVKSSVNGNALDDVESTKSPSEKKKNKKENVSSVENKTKGIVQKEKSERKRKRKEEGDEKPAKKVKYEKNHISKTDGSGSEASSNQIKIKQVNGNETNKTKCSIQTSLDDFFSKNSEKSDQDSEGSKEKKKSKSKEKKDAGQESLIEKLLTEARKSLKLKSGSPANSKSEKKKEKKEK